MTEAISSCIIPRICRNRAHRSYYRSRGYGRRFLLLMISGAVLNLCQERRGEQVDLSYVGKRAMVVYTLPLNEVVFDFYDRLKSVSKGYASFDYVSYELQRCDLVKMSILVNGE